MKNRGISGGDRCLVHVRPSSLEGSAWALARDASESLASSGGAAAAPDPDPPGVRAFRDALLRSGRNGGDAGGKSRKVRGAGGGGSGWVDARGGLPIPGAGGGGNGGGGDDDDGSGLSGTVLAFRAPALNTVGRNRRGVRTVECAEVVTVVAYSDYVRGGNDGGEFDDEDEDEDEFDDEDGFDGTGADPMLDKSQRHRVFAEWLVRTYGAEFLSRGSGVLDVAGGNGALSSSLVGMGVPSTLLDPNPRCGKGEGAASSVSFRIIAEPLEGDGSDLTDRADGDDDDDDDDDGAGRAVRDCSLVAGMHPDQATEASVDLALRLGVPFAILPCCVMPKLFPHRRQNRRDADMVRSYSAFCRYLLEKRPSGGEEFRQDRLPFAGRNLVIFVRPPE